MDLVLDESGKGLISRYLPRFLDYLEHRLMGRKVLVLVPGEVCATAKGRQPRTNLWFKDLGEALQKELEPRKSQVIPLEGFSADSMKHHIHEDLRRIFSGVVVLPAISKRDESLALTDALGKTGLPYVVIDTPLYDSPNFGHRGAYVAYDHLSGGRRLARHMAKAIGPGRPCVVLYGHTPSHHLRVSGILRELEDNPHRRFSVEPMTQEGARQVMSEYLETAERERTPGAVICCNDEFALGAEQALRQFSTKDNWLIGGYDGRPDVRNRIREAKPGDPMVATVVQDLPALTREAVKTLEALLKRENGKSPIQPKILDVTVESRPIVSSH